MTTLPPSAPVGALCSLRFRVLITGQRVIQKVNNPRRTSGLIKNVAAIAIVVSVLAWCGGDPLLVGDFDVVIDSLNLGVRFSDIEAATPTKTGVEFVPTTSLVHDDEVVFHPSDLLVDETPRTANGECDLVLRHSNTATNTAERVDSVPIFDNQAPVSVSNGGCMSLFASLSHEVDQSLVNSDAVPSKLRQSATKSVEEEHEPIGHRAFASPSNRCPESFPNCIVCSLLSLLNIRKPDHGLKVITQATRHGSTICRLETTFRSLVRNHMSSWGDIPDDFVVQYQHTSHT